MPNPIKVLYIHHGGGRGGAPNSLLRMVKELATLYKIKPVIACGFNEPHAKDFFQKNGFSPIHLPIARFTHVASWWPCYKPYSVAKLLEWLIVKQPRSKRGLRAVLQQVKPDIVHLNSLTIAPLAPLIKQFGIPVVLHVREPANGGCFGFRLWWLKQLAIKYVDHIIYICEDNQNRLTGPIEKSSVIYDPLPFEKFDKKLDCLKQRETFRIPVDAKVLFFPGGSSLGIKGIFPFLKALGITRAKRKDIYAIIPGIGERISGRNQERIAIEKMIQELKLENCIFRFPFVNEVEKYYAAADVIVAPFVIQHFSLAVIEAGAMKKPVIGSRIGGIEEMIEDGKNGFLVQPNDENDMAEKILNLFDHPKLASEMGKKGYYQALELCSADTYALKVMTLYEKIYERCACDGN